LPHNLVKRSDGQIGIPENLYPICPSLHFAEKKEKTQDTIKVSCVHGGEGGI